MDEENSALRPINFKSFLGWDQDGRPDDDDPAEAYHEAAKLTVAEGITAGGRALESDPEVQVLLARPVKRNLNLERIQLPEVAYPEIGIGPAIAARESRREFAADPLPLRDLSTLLHAAYGVTDYYGAVDASTPREPSGNGGGLPPRPPRRSVPSGGALYPLEIYPAVRNVEDLVPGLYHYDPLKHAIEVIAERELDETLRNLLVRRPELPDSAGTCGVVIFVAGIFWRTRFKYQARGYRLTLLEAGHVAQNLLLVAEALGLSAFPNVAFWDRQVDSFLGLDGVNESVLYSVLAGSSLSAGG